MLAHGLRTTLVLLTLSSTSFLTFSPLSTASAITESPTTRASIDPSVVLSQLSRDDWGANIRAQDADIQDQNLPRLLATAGIRTLRYPGGSLADAYHWKDNSITPGAGFVTFPGANFDALMQLSRAAHVDPIITVNYGSNSTGDGGGSPTEAAAWVKYSNVTKKYGVKYWEIGNENYGDWEANLHKVNSATQYARDALKYIADMKAVDPTIQIGLVLSNPGSSGNDPNWNDTVLQIAGAKADFVIIHWYPFYQAGTDQEVFDSPSTIASTVAGIRAQMTADNPQNAKHLKIMVTETNSLSGGPTLQSVSMVNALFLADDFTTFLEQPDVRNIDWWDMYNDGSTSTGDFGLLQDTTNTPYPTFYAMQMLNLFAKPGNRMIQTSSSSSDIKIHAVKKGNGDVSVLLINEDETHTRSVNVIIPGYKAATTAKAYTYSAASEKTIQRGSVHVSGNQFTASMPASSLMVVSLTPSS